MTGKFSNRSSNQSKRPQWARVKRPNGAKPAPSAVLAPRPAPHGDSKTNGLDKPKHIEEKLNLEANDEDLLKTSEEKSLAIFPPRGPSPTAPPTAPNPPPDKPNNEANIPCKFYNSKAGCNRPNCRYLHKENMYMQICHKPIHTKEVFEIVKEGNKVGHPFAYTPNPKQFAYLLKQGKPVHWPIDAPMHNHAVLRNARECCEAYLMKRLIPAILERYNLTREGFVRDIYSGVHSRPFYQNTHRNCPILCSADEASLLSGKRMPINSCCRDIMSCIDLCKPTHPQGIFAIGTMVHAIYYLTWQQIKLIVSRHPLGVFSINHCFAHREDTMLADVVCKYNPDLNLYTTIADTTTWTHPDLPPQFYDGGDDDVQVIQLLDINDTRIFHLRAKTGITLTPIARPPSQTHESQTRFRRACFDFLYSRQREKRSWLFMSSEMKKNVYWGDLPEHIAHSIMVEEFLRPNITVEDYVRISNNGPQIDVHNHAFEEQPMKPSVIGDLVNRKRKAQIDRLINLEFVRTNYAYLFVIICLVLPVIEETCKYLFPMLIEFSELPEVPYFTNLLYWLGCLVISSLEYKLNPDWLPAIAWHCLSFLTLPYRWALTIHFLWNVLAYGLKLLGVPAPLFTLFQDKEHSKYAVNGSRGHIDVSWFYDGSKPPPGPVAYPATPSITTQNYPIMSKEQFDATQLYNDGLYSTYRLLGLDERIVRLCETVDWLPQTGKNGCYWGKGVLRLGETTIDRPTLGCFAAGLCTEYVPVVAPNDAFSMNTVFRHRLASSKGARILDEDYLKDAFVMLKLEISRWKMPDWQPTPFPRWLKQFDGKRQKDYLRAQHDVEEYHAPPPKSVPVFIKTEMHFPHPSKVDLGIAADFLPRAISSVPTFYNVQLGPWFHALGEIVCNPHNKPTDRITFGFGMTCEQMGAWVEQRTHCHFIEIDWSAFDLLCRTLSGKSDTTIGNSLKNAAVLSLAFPECDILITSDDSLVASPEYVSQQQRADAELIFRTLGLLPKMIFHDHWTQASFCSKRFYPTKDGIVAGPHLARFALRHGHTDREQHPWQPYLRGKAMGYFQAASFLPFINAYTRTTMRITSNVHATMVKDTYGVSLERNHAPTIETDEQIYACYGWTRSHQTKLDEYLAGVKSLPHFLPNNILAEVPETGFKL